MGNVLSEPKEQFDSRGYNQLEQIQNTRYGDITVYSKIDNNQQKICVTKRTYHDEELFHSHEWQAENLIKLNYPSLVRMVGLFRDKQEEFCSSFYEIKQVYEYNSNDLHYDIEYRQKNKHIFYEERELWYILHRVLGALTYLKNNEIVDLDIRPSNILINHEWKVFILPKPINSQEQSSYQEAFYQQDNGTTGIYLSPTLFENLLQQNPSPKHSGSKTDVFTLGLSIIVAALLRNITEKIYDKNGTFNVDVFSESFHEMESRYSQNLIQFIYRMLNLDQNERPDADQLFNELNLQINVQKLDIADALYTIEGRTVIRPIKVVVEQEVLKPVEEVAQHEEEPHEEPVVTQPKKIIFVPATVPEEVEHVKRHGKKYVESPPKPTEFVKPTYQKKDIDKWVVKKTYPLETVVHEDIIPVYVPKSTYVPKESTYIPREYVPKESTQIPKEYVPKESTFQPAQSVYIPKTYVNRVEPETVTVTSPPVDRTTHNVDFILNKYRRKVIEENPDKVQEYVPEISNHYVPPTTSSYVPPTTSSYLPPTTSSYVPQTNKSEVDNILEKYGIPSLKSDGPRTDDHY